MEPTENGDLKENVMKETRKPSSNDNQAKKQKQTKAKASADDIPAPIPPDGGYGWMVTFCSFMVGFLVDGICFTFGFFFKEFQDYFGSNKSITSSVSSVLNGTYLSIGMYKSITSSVSSVLNDTYLSIGLYKSKHLPSVPCSVAPTSA